MCTGTRVTWITRQPSKSKLCFVVDRLKRQPLKKCVIPSLLFTFGTSCWHERRDWFKCLCCLDPTGDCLCCSFKKLRTYTGQKSGRSRDMCNSWYRRQRYPLRRPALCVHKVFLSDSSSRPTNIRGIGWPSDTSGQALQICQQ